jgi:hypothetical protein
MNVTRPAELRADFAQVPDDDDEKQFFRFKETDTWRQVQAHDLPLLTTNDADVQVMVNAMLDIRTGLSPRVEGERLRWRKLPAEITALVDQEYP